MPLDQAKYIFEIICKKLPPKSQNYEKAPRKKKKKKI
jgi:hypothetical protein